MFAITRNGYIVQRVNTSEEVRFALKMWRESYPGNVFDVEIEK